MKIAFIVLLFVVEAFSQSYVFNAYDASFVDSRDGKVYNLFRTDSSVWFVDNLKFNPDSVRGMDTLSPQSYCENFSEANCDYYGRLYFWDAAVNACPDGWHLPNKKEWKELVSFLEQQPYLKNVFVQSPSLDGVVDILDSKRRIDFNHLHSTWWMSELRNDTEALVVYYPYKVFERSKSPEKKRKKDWKNYKVIWFFSEISWHLHRVQIMPGRYMESDIVGIYLARCVRNKDGENYDVEIPTDFSGDEELTEFCG